MALAPAVAGLLFALGLGVGGMTDPGRVVGFLDLAGRWDPTLAFVMVGAVGVHAALRPLVLRRGRPVCAAAFPDLSPGGIDARLLTGATLFGVGWGLAGWCPGPAFVSVATGDRTVLAFVAAMVGGMALFGRLDRASRAASHGAELEPGDR